MLAYVQLVRSMGYFELHLLSICSIGEESFSSGNRPPFTDEPTFCVDPIGRTTFPKILLVFSRNVRWHYEFCARFPICLYIAWSSLQETTRSRSHIQPFPRSDGQNASSSDLVDTLMYSVVLWAERTGSIPFPLFLPSTHPAPCS